MISRLSTLYLESIQYTYSLGSTEIILLYVENLDHGATSSSFVSTGNEKTPLGGTRAFLSEAGFLRLSDDEKRSSLLDLIHNALVKFAESTSFPTSLLYKAYSNVLASDFYVSSYKNEVNTEKSISCVIQSRENWGSADHRLFVKDLTTNTIKTYPIKRTVYPFFDEIPVLTQQNMWDVILNTLQIFNPVEWEGEKFVMYWGKEKYVFDSSTEKLTQE